MIRHDLRNEQELRLDIRIYNGEDILTELSENIEFSYIEVDDSFDHEFGVRHESHYELFDEDMLVSDMLYETEFKTKQTRILRKMLSDIYSKIINEKLFDECWDETCSIFAEVDVMDWILTEEL